MRKWRALFWIFLLSFLMQLAGLFFSPRVVGGSNLTILFLSGISLIPLYGYSHQTAIGNKLIAVIIFSINTFITTTSFVIIAPLSFLAGLRTNQILFILAVGAVQIFLLYPQFLYAFKSNKLWSENA